MVRRWGDIHLRCAHSEASLPKKFKVHGRKMGRKMVLSCFYFCMLNPFGKLASHPKGQVKVIKTLWCVIFLFVMKEMNPADNIWQWAAMIRQSVQILALVLNETCCLGFATLVFQYTTNSVKHFLFVCCSLSADW